MRIGDEHRYYIARLRRCDDGGRCCYLRHSAHNAILHDMETLMATVAIVLVLQYLVVECINGFYLIFRPLFSRYDD